MDDSLEQNPAYESRKGETMQEFYYGEYGWTQLQHGHYITLTHLENDTSQFECFCGESALGSNKMVKALMLIHRMQVFPKLRARMT